jgi:hypothetical protein
LSKPGGIEKRLQDVFAFEIRMVSENVLDRAAGADLSNNHVLLGAAAAKGAEIPATTSFFDDLKPILDTRLRFENVDQDRIANEAHALTFRARVGFETGPIWQTKFLGEAEQVWSLDGQYDSTTNGNTLHPVIADPQGGEVNRLQLTSTAVPDTVVTAGRQRIVLDDHRFVGNVGWRQNEQTFDAVRVVNRSVPNLIADLTYLDQVNRVFGHESRVGRYNGDSWLANVAYRMPAGQLTVFRYQLQFDPIAGASAVARESSRTTGTRFAGKRPVGAAELAYTASYATQSEWGDNPLSFDLDYRFAEIAVTRGQYSVGAGIEVLEGDGAKGFGTPLATLHKFQGWADKFLTTPVDGVDDRYVTIGFSVRRPAPFDALSVQLVLHRYAAERGAFDYGDEVDALIQARWHRFSGLVKYADYQADSYLTDTRKLWMQIEYVW